MVCIVFSLCTRKGKFMKKFFKLLMLILFLGMFTFGTVGCPKSDDGGIPDGVVSPDDPETEDPDDDDEDEPDEPDDEDEPDE